MGGVLYSADHNAADPLCKSLVNLHKMSNLRVCSGPGMQKQIDLVTLKMVELCGRGGAGRDGDVVLADGGWLGAEGLLTAALTDLEFKEEMIKSTMIFTSDSIIIITII